MDALGSSLQKARQVAVQHSSSTKVVQRSGIALCLSGGGFRAALFHLGSLRRLHELGLLNEIRTISAVSGGSIIAAHLASRIAVLARTGKHGHQVPTFSDWDAEVGEPFRTFTRRDIRTGPIMSRVLPWNWFRYSVAARGLIKRYEKYLTNCHLSDLPEKPNFIFCSTDMVFGVNWVSTRKLVGDYIAGYVSPPPAAWSVARAVAASSCFPPIFTPLLADIPAKLFRRGRVPDQRHLLSRIQLTDGGVYDNLALEPVWKNHQVILVSDGGSKLSFTWSRDLVRQVMRYPAIVQSQAVALRQRWLISNFEAQTFQGAYWGISRATAGNSTAPGYTANFVSRVISSIRTDLDRFTLAEAAVLENHGYLLVDAVLKKRLRASYPAAAPPLAVPHPLWMDEDQAAKALKNSSRRISLRRLLML